MQQTAYDPELAGNYINLMNFKDMMLYVNGSKITPYPSKDTIESFQLLSLLKHDKNISLNRNNVVKIFPANDGKELPLSRNSLMFSVIFHILVVLASIVFWINMTSNKIRKTYNEEIRSFILLLYMISTIMILFLIVISYGNTIDFLHITQIYRK